MSAAANPAAKAAAGVYAHKLFAPPVYARVIRRQAILERVFHNDQARIVLLQGPAGHGKSTSLQQIKSACEQQGVVTGWLTFDEADNDTRRLLIHVQALLSSVRGPGGENAAEDEDIIDAGRRRQSDWVVDRLLKLGQPVALFLDDFQVLNNRGILAFFQELFERVPQNVRIYIGSRSVPEVGLSRLIVNQRAMILRPDDLRFSPSEVEQFFAATEEIDISREEIGAIYQRTEGWPAAVQLFRLSLVSPSVRRTLGDVSVSRPRELAEYLTDNVLALQSPEVQDFLLRTSLLTRLTAPLCDAVTGRCDSQELLLQLELSGLFLRSLDPETRWFSYHALFASILAEQLRQRSEALALEVHRMAAKWHLEHGDYEETVHHAIACRDYALAADTLDTWSAKLVAGAHLFTVERWCERLPFEEIAKRPSLAVKFAWTLIFLHRNEKLKPVLDLLQQPNPAADIRNTTDPSVALSMAAIAADDAAASFKIVERVAVHAQDVTGFGAFELGAAANLIGYRKLAQDDFEAAREHFTLARAHGERGEATFSRGYTYALIGVNLLVRGQLGEALERFKTGMAEQRMQVDKSFASASLASCYVWALYEAGELDRAEALFGQHHQVISDSVLLDFLGVAYLAMVRIHDVRGRVAQALDILDEAEAIAHAHNWKRFVRILGWERVRRALLAGDVERAEAIAALHPTPEGAPADWLLFCEDMEGEGLGRIRLALHTMELDAAAAQLTAEFSRHRGRVFRQIKLNLLEAQLHQRKESLNAAHRCLNKALQLATPGKFIRCFLDEGEAILGLLREEYQSLMDAGRQDVASSPHRAFIEQLLQASGTDLSRAPVAAAAQSLEPLTDREKEILMFLANGVSNKEMAKRLFVSENTVKFHLKNIYAKLAVASRLQAITAGRKLGLIPS